MVKHQLVPFMKQVDKQTRSHALLGNAYIMYEFPSKAWELEAIGN